jgi:hypothetical protein
MTLLKKIQTLLCSKTPIITLPDEATGLQTGSQAPIQKFKLYRLERTSLKQGEMILGRLVPKGAYLLLTDSQAKRLEARKVPLQCKTKSAIRAFVLPYYEACGFSVRLPPGGTTELVVTPSLTGCSIAVEGPSKAPELHHINFTRTQKGSRSIDSDAINRYIAKNVVKPTHQLHKENYISRPEQQACAATFMGFRSHDGSWSFGHQVSQFHYDSGKHRCTAAKLPIAKSHLGKFSLFNSLIKRKKTKSTHSVDESKAAPEPTAKPASLH